MSWVAGDDVTSQRKGIVVIVWFDKNFKISVVPKNMKHLDYKLHTTRLSALHVCTPDTPLYRLRRAVLTMRVSHHRVALQTHLGMHHCICGNKLLNIFVFYLHSSSSSLPFLYFPLHFQGIR